MPRAACPSKRVHAGSAPRGPSGYHRCVTPAHARGPSKTPLLDETIGANLERTASRFAAREALVSCEQGRRFTYGEFDAAVDELARGLLARGLAVGDRLGIWAPNRFEWTLVQYASAKLGLILV